MKNTVFELYGDKLLATLDELEQLMEVYPPAAVKKSRNLRECHQRLGCAQEALGRLMVGVGSDSI